MRRPWLPIVLGMLASALPGVAEGVADCERPRAELGIRHRFVAGDFRTSEEGARWVRFLTEPVVASVTPGGPADGRLEAGDVVVSVDGHLVTTEAGSRAFHFASGEPMGLVVRRRGELREVRVEPLARCEGGEPDGGSAVAAPPSGAPTPKLGIHFRCTGCGLDRVEGTDRWRFGSPPEVVSVAPGSPAESAGLRPGDLLVAIDGFDSTSSDGGRRFSEIEPGEEVRLVFERDGARREVTLVVGGGR